MVLIFIIKKNNYKTVLELLKTIIFGKTTCLSLSLLVHQLQNWFCISSGSKSLGFSKWKTSEESFIKLFERLLKFKGSWYWTNRAHIDSSSTTT